MINDGDMAWICFAHAVVNIGIPWDVSLRSTTHRSLKHKWLTKYNGGCYGQQWRYSVH
jgi:hypothetical protein